MTGPRGGGLHGGAQRGFLAPPRLAMKRGGPTEPPARQRVPIFGSRMMERFPALKGGMPLYKYVGNRILTKAQNALLRTRLSEFHSGYRIYSVQVLQRIPFQLNTDAFHFDTEVIIQLLNAKARI